MMDVSTYAFIVTEVFFFRNQLRALVKFRSFFYDVEGCIILFVSKILSVLLWFYRVILSKVLLLSRRCEGADDLLV